MKSACDVQLLLHDRGISDDYYKISASALRPDFVLPSPAAKSFVKEAIKDSTAWGMLKDKSYIDLLHHPRTGSFDGRDGVVAAIASLPLPPVLSTASTGSKNKPGTTVPLAAGFLGGVNSTCSWISVACHHLPRGVPTPHVITRHRRK